MIGTFGHRAEPSSGPGPIYGGSDEQDRDQQMIRMVQTVWSQDPYVENSTLAANCIQSIQHYFMQGGAPNLLIPDLENGDDCTLLEFIYQQIEQINEEETIIQCEQRNELIKLLRLGQRKIEENSSSFSIHEAINHLYQLLASDPDFNYEADRLLEIIDKFLSVGGNPLYALNNIHINDQYFEHLAIFELLHILWRRPNSFQFAPFEWGDPSWDDPQEGESKHPVVLLIDRYKIAINAILQCQTVSNEDFLMLIRSIIDYSDPFKGPYALDHCVLYLEDTFDNPSISRGIGEEFLTLMEHFVRHKVNPCLKFLQIRVGGNVYTDVTCFQLVYLVWKHPHTKWEETFEKRFQLVIQALLKDPRTDLTHRFSEQCLVSHHFVNPNNVDYYRKKHPQTSQEILIWDYNFWEYDYISHIDKYEGYSLDNVTVAHYAVMVNDYVMLTAFLEKEKKLLKLTCNITKGKDKSGRLKRSIENSNLKIRDISDQHRLYRFHHISKVTLLHLAARCGYATILASLAHFHPNPAEADSENCIPQRYLQLSVLEGLVENNAQCEQMLRNLELVNQLKIGPFLPAGDLIIERDGYTLHYDTSRKAARFAYQRLNQHSFGMASREGHRWVDNLGIPGLNRVKDQDFVYSGFDRGHLVPAEDATCSEALMADTFHPENAVAQDLSLNRGAWSRLEAHVRSLVPQYDLVEVFTGPLFVEKKTAHGRVLTYPLMGPGGVHIPTHLFKVIFGHTRTTTTEVYIFPNAKPPPRTKFSAYRKKPDEGINFIQEKGGIIFNEWLSNRSQASSIRLLAPPLLLSSRFTRPSHAKKAKDQIKPTSSSRDNPTIQKPMVQLDDGTSWIPQKTEGKGACALHALLGTKKHGKFVYPAQPEEDPSKAAKQAFVNKLSEKITLPKIRNAFLYNLYALLNEFHTKTQNRQIPSYESRALFQSGIGKTLYAQVLERHPEGFDNIMIQDILDHPGLFISYASAVQKSDYYFSDHEIKLAAYLFDKRVQLCAYNSEHNRYDMGPEIFNRKKEDFVLIAHNGTNHYERCMCTQT